MRVQWASSRAEPMSWSAGGSGDPAQVRPADYPLGILAQGRGDYAEAAR